MGPSSNEIPALNLPPPVGETAPTAAAAETASGAERAPAVEVASQPRQSMPPLTPPIPLPSQPVSGQAVQTGVTTTTSASDATGADEGDLIEKEWVTKAKAIVERTRDDPHTQTKELTAFKAEYMKQRYGKSIKLDS